MNSDGYTLGRVLAGLEVEYRACGPQTRIVDVVDDPECVRRGSAYIAVENRYGPLDECIDKALASGVAVVLLGRERSWAGAGPRVWLPEISSSLAVIAANIHGWPGRALRLAGVTGTNGKTTTTFLVSAALAAAGRRHARLGTTGHKIVDHEVSSNHTTPYPLRLQELLAAARRHGATDAIMEVSSHGLALARVAPLRFDAVGLTSFGRDHLDFHSSVSDYLAAKCLLARQYLDPGGVAVAASSAGEAAVRFLGIARERGARAWRVAREPGRPGELRVVDLRADEGGMVAEIETPAGAGVLRSPLMGAFNLDNLLVSVGLCLGLGLELGVVLAALREQRGAPGRLEHVTISGSRGPRVFVDYAHTPEAVARVLQVLRPRCTGRLWVVLGCGGDRDRTKRPEMGRLAVAHADRFVATSDNPRTEDPEAIIEQMLSEIPADRRDRVVIEPDRRRAIATAVSHAGPDDIVLLAGKGHEAYQIIGTRKIHLDDREEAVAALRMRACP